MSLVASQPNHIKIHYKIVAHLLKSLVADKFKRMARDEVLSKFLSNNIDPALLVDLHMRAEVEALDLAEVGLLKLIDTAELTRQLEKSALKIQEHFQFVYGEKGGRVYLSEDLLLWRVEWLRRRVLFFQKWLSLVEICETPADLGFKTFRTRKSLDDSLKHLFEIDAKLAEATVQATPAFFRFLMLKQLQCEADHLQSVWKEFRDEVFKKIQELP